jgi:radical SAM protein with 4Fe4S-binding SPASM domain
MLELANKRGHRLMCFTTLFGLNREDMKRLECLPFESFAVHVPDETNFKPDLLKWVAQFNLLQCFDIQNVQYAALGKVRNDLVKLIGASRIAYPVVTHHYTRIDRDQAPYIHGEISCGFNLKANDQWIVHPNGDVSVCFRDYDMTSLIGNLNKQTYYQIANGNSLIEFTRKQKTIDEDCPCRYCEAADTPLHIGKR